METKKPSTQATRVDVAMSPDKTAVRLSMDVTLAVDALHELIDKLAEIRAHMQPEVPRRPVAGSITADQLSVGLLTDPDHMLGPLPSNGVRLLVRDPGFGWKGFDFPERSAIAIRDWLASNLPGTEDVRSAFFKQVGDGDSTAH